MITTISKTLNQRTVWLILGLSLVSTGTVGGWLFWQQSQQEAQQTALQTQTAPVVRQDVTIKISATGTVRPMTPINISPKQSGQVAKLYVDQGSRVKVGQLLVRMDDTNLQGQLLQDQGSLAAAEANLRKLKAGNRPQEIQQAERNLQEAQAQIIASRSTYESNVQLFASGAISRNALDTSRSTYEANQAHMNSLQQQYSLMRAGSRPEDINAGSAQVMQARGALETIQTQIKDTFIRAPFAGIVTQKYADAGAFVTPTTSASATTSATSSSILALANALEAIANVSGIFTILLGGSAAISLVVGGIGIMNIMLVSVTERTREIGVRKAIGARSSDILWQFLIEAVVLALTGGLLGIALGVGSSVLTSLVLDWPINISTEAIALSFSVSLVIGLFFGVYPARQAARLDPITALRSE